MVTQPKARIVARLWSPAASSDPLQSVCSALLRMLVDDALDDVAYDASLAGLQSSVGDGDHCVDLAVSGFRCGSAGGQSLEFRQRQNQCRMGN